MESAHNPAVLQLSLLDASGADLGEDRGLEILLTHWKLEDFAGPPPNYVALKLLDLFLLGKPQRLIIGREEKVVILEVVALKLLEELGLGAFLEKVVEVFEVFVLLFVFFAFFKIGLDVLFLLFERREVQLVLEFGL